MESINSKELIVMAIENGTVIDHIPSNKVFQVIKILNLENYSQQLLFGTNLDSKKYGKKGIIKVKNLSFANDEINKIALVAPSATIIIIKNFQVVEKFQVNIPDNIVGIVKCINPKCITNFEQATTKFKIIDKQDVNLLCHYCEKITKKENIQFM